MRGWKQEQFRDRLRDLNEIYLQLGRWPEAVFADPSSGRLSREPLAQVKKNENLRFLGNSIRIRATHVSGAPCG